MQPLEGLAGERYGYRPEHLRQQAHESGGQYGEVHVSQPVDCKVAFAGEIQLHRHVRNILEQGSDSPDHSGQVRAEGTYNVRICLAGILHHRSEDSFEYGIADEGILRYVVLGSGFDPRYGGASFLSKHGLEHAVGKDCADLSVVEIPDPVLEAKVHLQGCGLHQERVELARGHRISHGDVDVLDPGRDAVKDRQEQALVRKDNCRVDAHTGNIASMCPFCQLAEYGRELYRLPDGRGHSKHVDARNAAPDVFKRKSLGELHDVVLHEVRRLVARVTDPSFGPVPAEGRQPCIPHPAHHFALTFVQGVESGEYEMLRTGKALSENVRSGFLVEALCERPVYHALVSLAFG